MNLSQLGSDETLFLRRIADLCDAAERGKRRFSPFLDERQALLAREYLRQRGREGVLLYGGYPDAVRCVLGAFPSWEQPEEEAYPIAAVAIHFPKGEHPSHRDVLGSLMGLQIKRDSVGDILIIDHRCNVFLLEPVARLVLSELKKVGRTGVRCEVAAEAEFQRNDSFLTLRGTVSSQRMDCLVSMLIGVSREKSAGFIRSELVQKNHVVLQGPAREFETGDVISIRGYGKYIVDEVGNPTRKGRLPVLCRKYK